MSMTFHYLDNASTIFPKPPEVLEAMVRFYTDLGVNPGRGAFQKARDAEEYIDTTRRLVAEFFGGTAPERLIFCANSSDALNIALFGTLKSGDHVISTMLEHNSVLRPLNVLAAEHGLEVDFLPFDDNGQIPPEVLQSALRPNTRAVVVNHGSNVLGTVLDLEQMGNFAREHGLLHIVDTSQTAGVLPIDVNSHNIDILCFTGHKSLLGPTGIGGLYLKDEIDIRPIRVGGSGIASDDPFQPRNFPYRLEVGTPNTVGIAGLRAAIEWLNSKGLDSIHHHEMRLANMLVEGIKDTEGVKLFYAESPCHQLPVVSLQVRRAHPAIAGKILDAAFGIATRCGCHCAPLTHKHIGTYPLGTIRMSVGPFTSEETIETAITAVRALATGQGLPK